MGKMPLSGVKTVILGGDKREIVLAEKLMMQGASVTMAGFPKEAVPAGAAVGKDLKFLLEDAQILILPLSGTDENGFLRTVYTGEPLQLKEAHMAELRPGALVLTGSAQPFLREWCETHQLQLTEVGERDELAILNAVPTAEGAIQIAMLETDTTIFGTPCTVVGMGRVGTVLTRTLQALGARVTVADRDAGKRALAQTMGCMAVPLEGLTSTVKQGGVLFNTVPAPVLTEALLRQAHPELFIIDLATKPGGTDFTAALRYGIKALLAPGLPGKAAPYSAGCILAEVLLPLIVMYQEEQERKRKQEGRI